MKGPGPACDSRTVPPADQEDRRGVNALGLTVVGLPHLIKVQGFVDLAGSDIVDLVLGATAALVAGGFCRSDLSDPRLGPLRDASAVLCPLVRLRRAAGGALGLANGLMSGLADGWIRTPPQAGPFSPAEPWWSGPAGRAGRLGGGSLSADLMVWRRVSACRPGPEFLGVAYDPDVLDPVACDVEREHRHGDAVLLSHQAGLAVDGAFQERHVAGRPVGDFDPGARDLLAAFDGAQEGSGEAAAVGDRRGVGVEQADQGVDVLGFPACLKALTMPAWRAVGVAGACAARMRRRAEEASWRHAAGVRPTISATSAKE